MFEKRIKTHHSAMAEGKKYALGPRPVSQYLTSPEQDRGNGTIYIHVPFCPKICSFCNMRRSLQDAEPDYHRYVVKEIENYAKLPYIQSQTFDAVYFGGGTPTMLSDEAFREILQALFSNLSFTEDAEVTVETTVTELTEEKITVLGENHVNRFSVGVQTFNDEERIRMNRVGSGEKAYQKLKYLKDQGKFTLSMDLIYNYAGQTLDDLRRDLESIQELELDGFSMYSLIDMKGSRIDLSQDLRSDEMMFREIAETMEAAGYSFLELTKMVKGDQYRYIMNRHRAADTLPLGAGAGGSVNHLMMMNEINLDKYRERVEHFDTRKGMLFRPEYDEITRFKGDIQTLFLPGNETLYRDQQKYQRYRQQLMDEGYVKFCNDKYKLTDKGVFWGNTISRELSDMI